MRVKISARKTTCVNSPPSVLTLIGRSEMVELELTNFANQDTEGCLFIVIGDQSYEVNITELRAIANGFHDAMMDNETVRALQIGAMHQR